ncbi:hypothetical protein B0H14DRAFT_2559323 [Mycena olivaceomarginata]|nr:hypothetical protein B0H14DRAFT_2559323 [Mycena olivaceomarginata]
MSDPTIASTQAKPHSRKKHPEEAAGLPHKIDSARRTRAATQILVKLLKSMASAPANLNESSSGAEIPKLGDTRTTTTDSAPLPVSFSNDASKTKIELTCSPTPPNELRFSRPNSTREVYTMS